ncbi:MAG: hypothetical protein ISS28_08015 [Candidatus Cloacimonetes bacterium]|nr:hypothetical protein [Candidatus Cloacimonadota bacterium]
MSKKIRVIIVISALVCCLLTSCTSSPPFEHYGMYLKLNEGYEELEKTRIDDLDDFLSELSSDTITIISLNDMGEYINIVDYSPSSKQAQFALYSINLENMWSYEYDDLERKIELSPVDKQNDLIKISTMNCEGIYILKKEDINKNVYYYAFLIGDQREIQQAFSQQTIDANRQALVVDANNFASMILAYFKTPKSHGGGGGEFEVSLNNLEKYFGYKFESDGSYTNDNGTYELQRMSGNVIKIIGIGIEVGNDGMDKTKIIAIIDASSYHPITMSIEN